MSKRNYGLSFQSLSTSARSGADARGAIPVPSHPTMPPRAGIAFIQSRPQRVGETTLRAPLARNATSANENLFVPLPSGSLPDEPARPSLELLNPGSALLEIIVGGITGLGIVFAFFLALFCQF